MIRVGHVQGSQPWLDWRVGGIGSSDAMIIAAANGMIERQDWMSRLDDLFEEKMTGVSKVIENPRMTRGKEGEPAARAAFEQTTGLVVSPVCAEMASMQEIRASFDGVSFLEDYYVEIKCPDIKVHELAKQGDIVDYYMPQVAHQGLVLWGHPSQWPANGYVYFVSYVPETGDLAIVKKQASDIAPFALELYGHELVFLDCVRRGVPPCGAEFAALAEQYLAIETELQKLEDVKETIRQGMFKIAEDRGLKTLDGGGVIVTKVPKKGNIDTAKLYAAFNITAAEVERYRKKSTEFWQARIDKDRTPADAAEMAAKLVANPDPASVVGEIVNGPDDFWGAYVPPAPPRQKATSAAQCGTSAVTF